MIPFLTEIAEFTTAAFMLAITVPVLKKSLDARFNVHMAVARAAK